MIRFIKKWWLLQNLRKAIKLHTNFSSVEKLAMGRKVLLSQHFFIVGDKDYPGLVYKSLRRFSWILWRRKKDNPKKLKKLIQEYNDIFEVCVKEKYIEMNQTPKGLMPSTATPLADKISGWFGLLQGLLKKYHHVWILIIIPLLGAAYFKQFIEFLWNFIKTSFNL